MRRGPLPAPGNRGPLVLLYLFLLGATVVLLRFAGRGRIAAVAGGLILAGVLTTLLVLLGSSRR